MQMASLYWAIWPLVVELIIGKLFLHFLAVNILQRPLQ